jgi:hypothetical protein
MKKILNLILLIAISFSIAHGVVLDTHQDSHCSVEEFVTEFSEPIQHDLDEHEGDICNTHFMLHLSFLIPSRFSLFEIDSIEPITQSPLFTYHYIAIDNTFRPPIV